jgi:hypothetical protein
MILCQTTKVDKRGRIVAYTRLDSGADVYASPGKCWMIPMDIADKVRAVYDGRAFDSLDATRDYVRAVLS